MAYILLLDDSNRVTGYKQSSKYQEFHAVGNDVFYGLTYDNEHLYCIYDRETNTFAPDDQTESLLSQSVQQVEQEEV
jgi:hypothetical protein